MPRYEVRVATRKGPKTLQVEAITPKDAEKVASRQGKVSTVRRQYGFDMTPGMTASERYTFMLRMSTLMGSKVGTAEGLRLMAGSFTGNIKRASQGMLERIESGMDLPTAMEQDRRNFPSATTALVKAGTASGESWRAMRDAAEFEYKMANAHKGSMKQVYQAIGSFLTAGIMMIGTTEYFGPMVMDNEMFKNAKGVDVEWARTLGDVCTGTMIVLMVIFGIFAWFGTIGRQIVPNLADKIILKIPYYKDLILSRNNHVTLYKLGLLIDSGVRIEEALNLTVQSSPRGAMKSDLTKALHAVRKGQSWAKAMTTLHDTDKAALGTSTDRKDIARTLSILANQYSELYIQRISTFAPLVSMIAALFMTLAGVVMFAQTIMPMLQMSASY